MPGGRGASAPEVLQTGNGHRAQLKPVKGSVRYAAVKSEGLMDEESLPGHIALR